MKTENMSYFYLKPNELLDQPKKMATHSRVLAWRIPWTEEPDGLYSPWNGKSQTGLSD